MLDTGTSCRYCTSVLLSALSSAPETAARIRKETMNGQRPWRGLEATAGVQQPGREVNQGFRRRCKARLVVRKRPECSHVKRPLGHNPVLNAPQQPWNFCNRRDGRDPFYQCFTFDRVHYDALRVSAHTPYRTASLEPPSSLDHRDVPQRRDKFFILSPPRRGVR